MFVRFDSVVTRPEPADQALALGTVPAARRVPVPPPSALDLLRQARLALAEARVAADHHDRFLAAYLSALRSGAAVLATRARPEPGLGRPRSVWGLLAGVAPGLAEWAGFFESYAARRAAVQDGERDIVSVRDADDLERQVHEFTLLAEAAVYGRRR
ncbi:SAV_6107 family HEPN domain-containing protein [Actinoalloteichus hymeniacidonis]|uniref:SAV-6107-like HEPN domain-containing protein n=1 Tax=Actinoalloteichus hymeniacidonis TaxID=340345 RepID=A0AAC9HT05_9PSEU|nr:SAV_6107 family HEPN domain-containing protein [Actinoalloteichus hymeniacidonis]AOS65092.1 hypothetical protein TL08_21525 [Actinoalloteichus hymeniacidonis]MBB5906829.1 hypothetical protein [Actinoalloteichus hymeniacidonis]